MTRRKAGLPPLADAEEAEIQAGIAQDPDNPEIAAEQFARMRPAAEVMPITLYSALAHPRGEAGAGRDPPRP